MAWKALVREAVVGKQWPEKGKQLLREHRLVLLLSAAVYLMARYSVTYGAGSDPRYSLIVSQSILDNGTIQLNAYRADEIWGAPADFEADPNILNYNGRFYNYFPVGPSLLSLPFVALARAVGWDMRLPQDNVNAQRLLSALTSVLVLWLLYLSGNLFLDRASSLLLAAVSLLGSTLISTLAVALWSSNFSVPLMGMALLLLARYASGKAATVHPLPLGGLLFLSFICRASAAAFILPVLLYLWLKDRRQMLLAAFAAGLPLGLFLLWSRQEFGNWLPIYYSAQRLQVERDPLWLALFGHLFSPARGLFIYSPFLLLLIPGLWLLRRKLRHQPLAWLCLCWIGLHLFGASRGATWWGGDSFGPRILTELMLPFALLSIMLWGEARAAPPAGQARLFAGLYLLLAAPAIFIHSYQGLFNYSTALWNVATEARPAPPFTPARGDLFNWRIPQFLASNEMLCRLEAERAEMALGRLPLLRPYSWGEPLSFGPDVTLDLAAAAELLENGQPPSPGQPALFIGWDPVDNDRAPHRATQCQAVHILFQAEQAPPGGYALVINTAAFGQQRAIFSMNGLAFGEWTFVQQPRLAPQRAELPFDRALLRANASNDLAIHLPDARRASYFDPSRLGLAVVDITINPR